MPGVYYDTDAKSTAVTTVLSMAGRHAPKPKGYALQVLPHLWSFDVDLREVPTDHPIQYVHPEGARSIDELTREQAFGSTVGRDLEFALQFAWAVNQEAEAAVAALLGQRDDPAGLVIEIDDASLDADAPLDQHTDHRDEPTDGDPVGGLERSDVDDE